MNRHYVIILALLCTTQLSGCGTSATASPSRDRTEIRSLVIHEALDLGVPVALALAVAHAESNFDPRAESRAGARGVMQIMPATARNEYGIAAKRLWHPRVNIRLGLHFLGRLIKRYRGRVDIALSHYNGGSAVGPPSRARVIPATRRYVNKIRRLEVYYRRQILRGVV